jgi:hypothetical protein
MSCFKLYVQCSIVNFQIYDIMPHIWYIMNDMFYHSCISYAVCSCHVMKSSNIICSIHTVGHHDLRPYTSYHTHHTTAMANHTACWVVLNDLKSEMKAVHHLLLFCARATGPGAHCSKRCCKNTWIRHWHSLQSFSVKTPASEILYRANCF